MQNDEIVLKTIRPILPGSVYKSKIKCGKKKCRCFDNPEEFHIIYQWSGIIDGKNTSRTLTKKMYLECKKRTEKYKKLKNLLKKECAKALKNPPWKKNTEKT